MSRTVAINELSLYGAIKAFMSKLYDRTHSEERTVISEFLCEATAKECLEHIKNLSEESVKSG